MGSLKGQSHGGRASGAFHLTGACAFVIAAAVSSWVLVGWIALQIAQYSAR